MSADSPPASGSMSEVQAPSLIGQVLDGRYRIIRKLGEGGMGEVFAAEHVHIEKRFAIKLLRPEIVSNPEAVTRFRQEARSSSSIGHRNIIAVEDFGQLTDGRIYMCMELLNGAALNDMLTQPMPVDRLLNILIQTGHGLAAAHAKGIIHRDMKPENVFVTIGPNGEDVPKILDFGIAKVAGNDGQNHLTRTGTIFGTPFYMAPEQALGNPVDARTDIYAVGVIMYECFAGSLPFQGESFMGILTQHITMDPEPVAQRAAAAGRHLPPGLADVIMRCLMKNPAQRFSTMDELVGILIQIYRGIVGPGMSTYMEAFPVAPTAGHQVQHTPPPMTRPFVGSGPQTATVAAIGPSGSVPAASASGMYSGPVAKKSKAGLIVAVLAVLAVGGGVAAFVIVNQGTPGKGSGSQVASNDPGSNHGVTPADAAVVAVVVDAAGPVVVLPPVVDASGAGVGAVDAGSEVGPIDAGSDVGIPNGGSNNPPPGAVVQVLLLTRSGGSFIVFENGEKVLDGPDNLDVPKGGKRTVVIKAKGFKDKTVVVDSTKKRLQVSLERLPSTTTTTTIPTHVPPPPVALDCADKLIDASNDACRKQYCAGHREQPKCMTE